MATTPDQRMDIKLQQVASCGNVKGLRSLIRDNRNILLSKTVQGNTALHIAAQLGHRAFAKEILGHVESLQPLQLQNADGDTPLHLALRSGHKELAALLANRAAMWPTDDNNGPGPLQVANAQGNTVLHEAVICRNARIAQMLLDADPGMARISNWAKESPLDIAVRNGLAEVVKKILAHLSVERREEVEQALFYQAVLGGHIEIANMLLEKRANLWEVVDGNDNNALHNAVQKDKKAMVKMLLQRYPSLAYQNNKDEQSPLHAAAFYGSSSAIREILKNFPDTAEQVDSHGMNAIHIAARDGKIDALKCLLRHIKSKEIINKADKDGNTPLHLAAMNARIRSTVVLSRDKRIDPCLRNNERQTARSLYESLQEMSTNGMIMWNELKQLEAKKCKSKELPPVATLRSFNKKMTSSDRYFELSVNVYTLVAALIVTVTFAANFTMPGGFNQEHGTAILERRPAFKVFVIANTTAMCSSLVVVFCFIWAWRDPIEFKLKQLIWGHRLTVLACVAMLVSLMTAVHLVLTPKSLWLSIAVIVIGCSTPVVAALILGLNVLFVPLR